MTGRRTFLPAVVPPWAAYVIARDLGPRLEAQAAALRDGGQHVIADQVMAALASMREAGRQRMDAHQQVRSEVGAQAGVGTSEVPTTAQSAGSERVLGSGLLTREVAEILRVSDRQVRNLRVDQRISATWSRGRWVFDEVSVAKELERRRRNE